MRGMQGLIITHRGLEDVSAKEVNAKTRLGEGVVFLDLKDADKLIYMGRSFSKVLKLLTHFKFKEFGLEKVAEIEFPVGRTFRVTCRREGKHEFSSEEVASELGKIVRKKTKAKVDLENPETIVYAYILDNHCYIGIDLSRVDLSKRSYNVFSVPSSLKPSVAYGLAALSGLKKDHVFINPFCGNGMIVIEAALALNNISPHLFDKHKLSHLEGVEELDKKSSSDKLELYGYDGNMNHIKNSLKNAKIANIHKCIHFSRLEVEWLDTKFKRDGVDRIVTRLPDISKRSKEAIKQYRDMFYNAEYVLKKTGRIVVASRKDEDVKMFAEEYRFKLIEERDVWQGKEKLKVMVWGK